MTLRRSEAQGQGLHSRTGRLATGSIGSLVPHPSDPRLDDDDDGHLLLLSLVSTLVQLPFPCLCYP